MTTNWNKAPVSQIANIFLGGTPSRSVPEYWGGGIKWATARDVTNCSNRYLRLTEETISSMGIDNSAAKLLDEETVVITARGTVGAICLLGERMAFNQTCYGLQVKPYIKSVYLYYALKSQLEQIGMLSYGTVFNTITMRTFDELVIPVPPVTEQRAIAAILGSLDDKIELNQQMNQTLEAMAQEMFKSWFVDFEPFQDQDMQDSQLGPIPKGWLCTTVTEAVDINPTRKLERGENTFYVDMAALPTKLARVIRTIRRPYSGSGSRFTKGDVLFARITPCLENGKTAIVDFLQDGDIGCGSTEFIVLGPKPPLSMAFNYCLARYPEFRAHAIQAMTGTSGRQRVDQDCFNHYWLVVPRVSVAEQFDDKVNLWFQKMKVNDDESNTLSAIRDLLLPKLLSGEIRVKDAGKFMEEAKI